MKPCIIKSKGDNYEKWTYGISIVVFTELGDKGNMGTSRT